MTLLVLILTVRISCCIIVSFGMIFAIDLFLPGSFDFEESK